MSGWVGGDLGAQGRSLCAAASAQTRMTNAGKPDREQTKPPTLLEAAWTAEVDYSSSDMDGNSRDEQRQQMRTRGHLHDRELTPELTLLRFLPCLLELMTYVRSEIENYLVFSSIHLQLIAINS